VHIILTFVSALPETTGLFLVGFVLILSGVVLRRVLVMFERGIPGSVKSADPKEHLPK
jgi:hypothetical protein